MKSTQMTHPFSPISSIYLGIWTMQSTKSEISDTLMLTGCVADGSSGFTTWLIEAYSPGFCTKRLT